MQNCEFNRTITSKTKEIFQHQQCGFFSHKTMKNNSVCSRTSVFIEILYHILQKRRRTGLALPPKLDIPIGKKKKRSAMRTCVAYEIELFFSVWCLIEFLLEELISDYG